MLQLVSWRRSSHTDGDFVARATEVRQAHGNGGSRRNTARHADVHLVQTLESGGLAEEQNVSRESADRYLRWRDTSVQQTVTINFEYFARRCGVTGRGDLCTSRV